jgi:GTP-binding protein
MSLFQNATYAYSVARPGDALPDSGGEIAFSGRSNAGKSSAINVLVGQRRLAFVSKTPGRTQMINFFSLAAGLYLVDLPGYGFAAAPGTIRSRWDALLGAYLRTREQLRGLVLVMDARRPMTDLDQQLIDFFWHTGRPIHVLLTKADKLSRSEAAMTLRQVQQRLAQRSPLYTAQLFSSLKRTGLEQAESVCAAWLGLQPGAGSGSAQPPSPSKRPRDRKEPGPGHRGTPATRGPRIKKPRAKGG